MSTYAYATTSTSTSEIHGDAGISVLDAIGIERGRETLELALDGDDGQLDQDTADLALEGLGWRRTGDWQESGGQWAAPVEQR